MVAFCLARRKPEDYVPEMRDAGLDLSRQQHLVVRLGEGGGGGTVTMGNCDEGKAWIGAMMDGGSSLVSWSEEMKLVSQHSAVRSVWLATRISPINLTRGVSGEHPLAFFGCRREEVENVCCGSANCVNQSGVEPKHAILCVCGKYFYSKAPPQRWANGEVTDLWDCENTADVRQSFATGIPLVVVVVFVIALCWYLSLRAMPVKESSSSPKKSARSRKSPAGARSKGKRRKK